MVSNNIKYKFKEVDALGEQYWVNYTANNRQVKSATLDSENAALRLAFHLEVRQKASVINVESSSGTTIPKEECIRLAIERQLTD